MSFQYEAGRIVRILEHWDDASEDLRAVVKYYLRLFELVEYQFIEDHGRDMSRKYQTERWEWCWHCGRPDDGTIVWLKDNHHLYSDRLCPDCEKIEEIKVLFTSQQGISTYIWDQLARSGAWTLEKYQGITPVDDEEFEKDIAMIRIWIHQILIYGVGVCGPGGPPPKLENGNLS